MGFLVIDQPCSVKMAGYWPSSFFCVFRDLDFVSVHKHAKKGGGQYPAILTEQGWSVKDLLYEIKHKFSLRDKARIPSVQDSSMSVSGTVRFILSAHEVRHVIRTLLIFISSSAQVHLTATKAGISS